MKLFSKKKDDDFYLIFEESEPSFDSDSQNQSHSKNPDALTPEEVLGFRADKLERYDSTNALNSLKKRISAVASGEKQPTDIPETEIIPKKETEQEENVKEPQQGLPKAVQESDKKISLLNKCMPYILDENGREIIHSEPLYKLQSVADILKSDSERSLERLSEKYDISFDDLGHNPYLSSKENSGVKDDESKTEAKTKTAENSESKNTLHEKEIFEEKIKITKQIKNVQSNVSFVISDIDMPSVPELIPQQQTLSQTATVTFTPVSAGDTSGTHISVSTKTQPIDLTGELVRLPDMVTEHSDDKLHLEKNEFEEFIPKEEFCGQKNAGKLIRSFSIKKRNSFLITAVSFFLTLLLAIARLPFMSGLLLAHTDISMIIASGITLINIIINCGMFTAITKIFSRHSVPDICALTASLATIVYAVFGIINNAIILDMLLLLSGILCFRALSKFLKASYMLSNLKQISSSSQKRALKLISDPAITFSMAKNAVEGDTLIAAPQKAAHVEDYMKYSTFGTFFGGRLPLITILSLILSVITGFAAAVYFDGAQHGFYAAAVIQCFAALPSIFLIDTLPLYRASKRLNKIGAMLAGKSGAEQVEIANAVVLNSTDLFPSGTVTLHQMKVLSENNLEDTIIRAASLTDALGSTLAPIFKKIAGTGNVTALPDSDTVKYEDRMGISGWVDNRLLFIGNRTLMEAHGIEVPSVEVDRRILRQGYFPVYLATRDKACALLMIQYSVNPDISHELRKLTGSGVTLLINNSDPNLTEDMICDYLGLYDDSVKVMTAAGCHMYKNTVVPAKSVSAPAAYKSNPLALPAILNCANKIKRSNILLTAAYVICAVLGAIMFAYTSFGGSGSLISDTVILLYGIITTAVTYLIYLTERP